MPFVDTNSHLTTKLHNFDFKCQSNSESYYRNVFFGTKFRGGQNFLFMMRGFPKERERYGADWLGPLLVKTYSYCFKYNKMTYHGQNLVLNFRFIRSQ